MQGARSVFPCARDGDEHKLDINNRRVRTHLYLREQVSFYRFCQMQAELHASVQVPKPLFSQVVALRFEEGAKEKAPLRGLHGYLYFLFPAPGGKPNLSPLPSSLKINQTVHKPLFICLSVVIAHVINCTRAFLAL